MPCRASVKFAEVLEMPVCSVVSQDWGSATLEEFV